MCDPYWFSGRHVCAWVCMYTCVYVHVSVSLGRHRYTCIYIVTHLFLMNQVPISTAGRPGFLTAAISAYAHGTVQQKRFWVRNSRAGVPILELWASHLTSSNYLLTCKMGIIIHPLMVCRVEVYIWQMSKCFSDCTVIAGDTIMLS